MEIRKYTDIVGVITTEVIPEGRMVLLCGNPGDTIDFGSRADLPGVKLPDTKVEAQRAKYCITWPVNNSNFEGEIKMFYPQPQYDWSLRRGGWDQVRNTPAAGMAFLTWPGNDQNPCWIPSGWLALAFDRGVFRVPSGFYVDAPEIHVAGALLRVCDTASDSAPVAGLLTWDAVGDQTIAVVEQYHDNGDLTFRTLQP